MQVEQLDRLEQGIILASLLDSRDALARLERICGPAGQRCLEAYRTVQDLDHTSRRRLVLALSRRLFSPLPAHVERVHPSWIQHLLVQESGVVAAIVVSFLPHSIVICLDLPDLPPAHEDLTPGIRHQICRDVLRPLQDMPPSTSIDGFRSLDDLVGWPEQRILDCLTHLGFIVLCGLMRRTETVLRDRVLERMPPDHRSKLRQAMHASLPDLPLPAKAPPLVHGSRIEDQLIGLGIHLVAPAMSPLPRQQLAQRLPRDRGLMLLDAGDAREGDPSILRTVVLADRWSRGGKLP